MVNKKRGTFSKNKQKAIINSRLYLSLRRYSETELKPILAEIKSRKKTDLIRISLTNYAIIRTLTIFEIFLLNQAFRIAKNRPSRTRKLFSDIKTGVPIREQIISTYNFTNLDDINTVFSILLAKDYLEEIKKESIGYAFSYSYEYAHIRYSAAFHKKWSKFIKIFEIRNEIVHHNKRVNLDYSQLRDYVGGLIQFLMCSIIVARQD